MQKISRSASFNICVSTGCSALIDFIGEGLLLLEGQKHAKTRKIINPTFKYNKIKGNLYTCPYCTMRNTIYSFSI